MSITISDILLHADKLKLLFDIIDDLKSNEPNKLKVFNVTDKIIKVIVAITPCEWDEKLAEKIMPKVKELVENSGNLTGTVTNIIEVVGNVLLEVGIILRPNNEKISNWLCFAGKSLPAIAAFADEYHIFEFKKPVVIK